jgi:hypothetical protein
VINLTSSALSFSDSRGGNTFFIVNTLWALLYGYQNVDDYSYYE